MVVEAASMSSKYDRLPTWRITQEHLLETLRATDRENTEEVTLPHGLQLTATLPHPSPLRCVLYLKGASGDVFITQCSVGSDNQVQVWTIKHGSREVRSVKFVVAVSISKLIFIPKHRVFIGYCSDLTLRVFADVVHKFAEISITPSPSTILCLAYNKEKDELLTGGVGRLLCWSLSAYREQLIEKEPYNFEIAPDEWVQEITVNLQCHQLLIQCDNSLIVIDYFSGNQTHYLENRHSLSLSRTTLYPARDYIITAAKDGSIKVWNTIVFAQMYEFIGHFDVITGLVMHTSEPLLISSSLDGTVRIWRLDTFELEERLDTGEPILGLKLINSQELAYWTETEIKIWRLNMYHSMFSNIQSGVERLHRVSVGSFPSRILCSSQDGSVRLLSPVTGSTVSIIYPIASHKVVADIVYDILAEHIYIRLAGEDEVLVFSSNSTPSQLEQRLVPRNHHPDKDIFCLGVISMEDQTGMVKTVESLIFAGHSDGTVSLLQATSRSMRTPVQAHCGKITLLTTSHGICSHGDPVIGRADRLVSSGDDAKIKIWAVQDLSAGGAVSLVNLKTVCVAGVPTNVAMMANVLAFSLETEGELYMYSLEDGTDYGRNYGMVEIRHEPEDDHTGRLTGLDCCPQLRLFASSGEDGMLKVWDCEGFLLREVSFSEGLQSLCFANPTGDILFGYKRHIFSLRISTYLPAEFLEGLLQREFEDEVREIPKEFDHTIQLRFDYADVKVYPLDLGERRLVQAHEAAKVTTQAVTETAEDQWRPLEAVDSPPHRRRWSRLETFNFHYQCLKTLVNRLPKAVPSLQESDLEGSLTETQEVAEPGQEMPLLAEIMPLGGALEDRKTEAGKRKRFYPIAPDGYIPNSVVRKALNFKPPPDVRTLDTWKLKPIPKQRKTGIKKKEEKEDVEGEEEKEEEEQDDFWEPRPRSTRSSATTKQSRVSSGRPKVEELTQPPEVISQPSHVDRATTKPKPDEVLTPPESPIPSSPAERQVPSVPSPVKLGPAEKGIFEKPRGPEVGRGGFKSGQRSFGPPTRGKKAPMKGDFSIEEDEEDDTHWLIKKITAEPWFPKKVPRQVGSIVSSFLVFLSNVDNKIHTQICDYIIQIHNDPELGYTSAQLNKLITKLTEQLKHSNAIYRQNAVRTLGELGASDLNTVIEIVPLLLDDNDQHEVEKVHLTPTESPLVQRQVAVINMGADMLDQNSGTGDGPYDVKRNVMKSSRRARPAAKPSSQSNTSLQSNQSATRRRSVISAAKPDLMNADLLTPDPVMNVEDSHRLASGCDVEIEERIRPQTRPPTRGSDGSPSHQGEGVRKEAVAALQKLAGIDDKDKLRAVFVDMGILDSYSSKEDEDDVLAALAERRAAGDDGTLVEDEEGEKPDSLQSWMDSAEWAVPGDPQNTEKKREKEKSDISRRRKRTKVEDGRRRYDVTDVRLPGKTRTMQYRTNTSRVTTPGSDNSTRLRSAVSPIASSRPRALTVRSSLSVVSNTGDCDSESESESESDHEPGPESEPKSDNGSMTPQSCSPVYVGSELGRKKKLLPTRPELYKVYDDQASILSESDPVSDHGDKTESLATESEKNGAQRLPALIDKRHLVSEDRDDQDTGIGTDPDSDIISSFEPGSWEGLLPYLARNDEADSGIQSDDQGSTRAEHSLIRRGMPQLTPIKSSSHIEAPGIPVYPENWREFFDRPSAQQRRLLEERRLAAQEEYRRRGRMSLPPIHYLEEDRSLVPGEVGVRLLHTVGVKERGKLDQGGGTIEGPAVSSRRLRVHDVPSKLSVHTTTQTEGLSRFGILDLKWKASVPGVVMGTSFDGPRQTAQGYDPTGTQPLPLLIGNETDKASLVSQSVPLDSCSVHRLPNIHGTGFRMEEGVDFEWEKPLPPAPSRLSRLENPAIRTGQLHYSHCYRLLKKRFNNQQTPSTNHCQSPTHVTVMKIQRDPNSTELFRRLPINDDRESVTLRMMFACET